MRHRAMLASLMAVTLVAAGCGSKTGGGDGSVAAKVNGEVISVADVAKVAGNFKRQGIPVDPTSQGATPEEKLYYTVVDRLIEQALVLQAAKDAGLEVTEVQIEDGVEDLKRMAGGEEGFQKLLAEHAITMDDVHKDMRSNLIMKAYFDQVMKDAPEVSEEDIQKFYNENPQHFASQPQVHARHILIRVRPEMTDMEKAEARKRAEQVLARARGGESFETLATQTSEDEMSAPNGGDLDWRRRGEMVAAFDSAAFSLKPGEMAGLVETEFGYHIIKVEETRMSEPVSLEEVHENIRGMLAQGKSQENFRKAVSDLRAKADLKIEPPSPETLEALKIEGIGTEG